MVLVVPIKKIIVKNEHIDTLFWRDSHKHIEIWIPLRHSISCKDLKINFSTKDIKITNGDLTLLELPVRKGCFYCILSVLYTLECINGKLELFLI